MNYRGFPNQCYRRNGCGSFEFLSCSECPASRPEYANRYKEEDEQARQKRFITENFGAIQRIIKVIDTHALSFDDVAELVEVCAPFCDAAGSVKDFVAWLKNKEER